ncbi:MAG: NAD(P)H-hydrate dehydratase, partial [Actinobacteria bacterium]|nr:NAD(P)H-hydrate dehydratase [Actinomycetota bacterium]
CGKVLVSDLGFKKEIDSFKREIQVLKADLSKISENPYRRKPDDHKKNHAVLIIAGSKHMPGACYFSAKSAMMAGASYVGIATEKEAIETVSKLIPEAVFHQIDFNLKKESLETIKKLLKDYSSVLIGPGLSRNEPNIYFAIEAIDLLSSDGIRTVIDGDALFALSKINKDLKLENSVLTPHIGEARRLLPDLKDQLSASLAISEKFQTTCVLKSSSTAVSKNRKSVIFSDASCNLATAGSGDILAGIIAAFLSYDEDTYQASLMGVAAQAHASLHLFKKYEGSSIISSDVLDSVRIVLKGLCGDYCEG